ncbi:serine/threonine-protein kinase [Actinomadura nitritigenes]|uniref:serine/threonine-protein kinase n=1 Tax=Actinomadura nitritigenes TaxID=134602 RepID=UPI003D8F19E8
MYLTPRQEYRCPRWRRQRPFRQTHTPAIIRAPDHDESTHKESRYGDDVEFRRRFAAEVTAAQRVGGFYTAQVVDADPHADPPWMVTAYVEGPSLGRAVAEHGPLAVERVARLGAGLVEGLAAIHECGLVHRDLKPANVLIAADGPRVIDFGISRALDGTSATASTAIVGTPAYMSPEQVRAGGQVGPPSDVFSLGSVLAFAATGLTPFGIGHPHAVLFRVVHQGPDLSKVPPALLELIASCLNKAPDGRPTLDQALALLIPHADSSMWSVHTGEHASAPYPPTVPASPPSEITVRSAAVPGSVRLPVIDKDHPLARHPLVQKARDHALPPWQRGDAAAQLADSDREAAIALFIELSRDQALAPSDRIATAKTALKVDREIGLALLRAHARNQNFNAIDRVDAAERLTEIDFTAGMALLTEMARNSSNEEMTRWHAAQAVKHRHYGQGEALLKEIE